MINRLNTSTRFTNQKRFLSLAIPTAAGFLNRCCRTEAGTVSEKFGAPNEMDFGGFRNCWSFGGGEGAESGEMWLILRLDDVLFE
ncbi:hypothetical protein HanIR_Chr02g0091291 [Helianthus annuus]|nr:hypothetical protein HanIR_Chr02g0091291 [Helianthus annuus]